jgi:hypothetical protein
VEFRRDSSNSTQVAGEIMTAQAASSITSAPLLQWRNNLIIHQALFAAAKFGSRGSA